jgi:hypothetical protein
VSDTATAVVAALVGGVISAAGTYLGIHWKVRKDLEAKYDESLRNLRMAAYGELWALTSDLAAFAPDRTPTRSKLTALSEKLTAWYFETGGLYLSEETRDACVALQRALLAVTSSDRWASPRGGKVDVNTFDHLREIASRLRTRMTYDVGTRRPFSFEEQSSDPAVEPADPRLPPADATADERWIFEHWAKRLR